MLKVITTDKCLQAKGKQYFYGNQDEEHPIKSKTMGTRTQIMGTEEHHLPKKNSLKNVLVDMNEIIGIQIRL